MTPARAPAHLTVAEVLAWLERRGTRRNREGMARYGIVVRDGKVFGVSMATMRPLVHRLGRDHAMARALWATGWHEARILAALIDEPARVTRAQMERWVRRVDNWALCDTLCFHLFDRTPHAWAQVTAWAAREEEFVRRAAFALLAGLAVHDANAPDTAFARTLPLITTASGDGRNFVRKAVSWALRSIGKRNLALHDAALTVARRLAESTDTAERWVGRDATRELASPAVMRRLAARAARAVKRRSHRP